MSSSKPWNYATDFLSQIPFITVNGRDIYFLTLPDKMNTNSKYEGCVFVSIFKTFPQKAKSYLTANEQVEDHALIWLPHISLW